MRRTDPLIAGGGPAGAAAAIALAHGGARPLLIERTRGTHDVVCGGFLGWDALAALDRLGVDATALGARPIGRVRVVAGQRSVEAELPRRAAGLSRCRLDAALLDAAAAAGAGVERGVTIRRAEGCTLHLADGTMLAGDALFLATGKHELRGLAREHRVAPSVGMRATLRPSQRLTRALDGVIELHLFDRGYAGLLLQEDGSANLCLSIAPERVPKQGIAALLAGLSAEAPRLVEAAAEAGEWTAIAGIPHGWRAHATAPGIFRLGDQAAVIASLAGDGVAIALASAASAVAAWHRHRAAGAEVHQRQFAHAAARPLAAAALIRRLAEGPWRHAALGLLGRLPLLPLLASVTRIEPDPDQSHRH